MEPRFNEVPRDWGNLFVISRVRYIEGSLYRGFVVSRVRCIEGSLYRGFVISRVRYIEGSLYRGFVISKTSKEVQITNLWENNQNVRYIEV